jgi:hypothetical protein
MRYGALTAVLLVLAGCSFVGPDRVAETGAISVVLPSLGARSALADESDIAVYVIHITSSEIGYSESVESNTGGIITIGRLEEGRYDIAVEARDAAGTVIFTGSDSADVFIGEVSFVQITLQHTAGYLDIEILLASRDSEALIEIEGIALDPTIPVDIVHGPGIFIERLVAGTDSYLPGAESMKVFSIETSGANSDQLKAWFDGPVLKKNASIIVTDTAANETYRWNIYEMSPRRYQDNPDGTTQFYLSVSRYEAVNAPLGLPLSYNETTDLVIEIEGVVRMAAEVLDNGGDQTLTLTFGYEAGFSETLLWIESFADGTGVKRAVSVITYSDDTLTTETHRQNYYEVFPIRFEQIDGFGTDIKGRYRLVVSYDVTEQAL